MNLAYAVTTWNGARLVETIQSLPTSARCLVIDNSQHGWPLAKAWNYAIERLCIHEGYDAVVICNDDILLDFPDPAGVGPTLARALLQTQYEDGCSPEALLVTGYNLRGAMGTGPDAANPSEGLRWRPHPDFSCFCTSRRLLEEVGPADERFIPAYFEDNDWHRRIQLAGFEGYSYAPYFHYASTTVGTSPERRAEVERKFESCKQHYIQKWGGEPGQETFFTPFNRSPALAR